MSAIGADPTTWLSLPSVQCLVAHGGHSKMSADNRGLCRAQFASCLRGNTIKMIIHTSPPHLQKTLKTDGTLGEGDMGPHLYVARGEWLVPRTPVAFPTPRMHLAFKAHCSHPVVVFSL